MKRSNRFNLVRFVLVVAVVGLMLGLTGSVFAQEGSIGEGNVEEGNYVSTAMKGMPDLRFLVDQADLIVIGQTSNVVSNLTVNEYGDELIVSDVSLKLEEVFKGDADRNQTLVLEGLLSGQIGEIAMASSDAPLFVQGERFVLFLEGDAENGFSVVGGELGKLNIDESNDISKLGQTLDKFRRELQDTLDGGPLPAIPDDNAIDQNAPIIGGPEFAPDAPDFALTGQRWAGASPVVGYVINNPGFNDANAGTVGQQNMAIRLAADTWTVTSGAHFGYQYNGTTALNTATNNGINVVMVRNATSGNALATAFWWFNTSTNLMTDCDIVYWDASFAFSAISAASTFDIRSVGLHELGHCLGLGHSSIGQASMFGSFAAGEQRRQLHRDDLAGSRAIYGSGSAGLWVGQYGYSAGGWRVDQHPRLMGDVNGDGRDDVVGFANAGVFVSLSSGGRFLTPSLWVENFGATSGGWSIAQHPRFLADVNGDGRDDVVGFGNAGVWVSTSQGMGFNDPALWVASYGYDAGGWRVNMHPRFMADVNGDGRDDVVGFGNAGVYVSTSTGTAFSAPSLWVGAYGYNAGGWRVEFHPRMMADVNADGRADVVGFANDGVYVSTSTGTGFSAPTRWVANYGYNAGGWRIEYHPRMMADVNGDGRDDVVGFGNAGVYVSTSTGSAFNAPVLWVGNFGYDAGGWRVNMHPRFLADVNGDGRDDVVGFGNAATYVALSTGSSFATPVVPWVSTYGYYAGGWRVEYHPRFMADVDGNGRADVVGFGNAGVYVSRSAFPSVFE